MAAPPLNEVFAGLVPWEHTPAELYLTSRQAYRPGLPPLPNLRWLPAQAGLMWPATQENPSPGPVIPPGAAGAVVFLYSTPARTYVAAELEVLDWDGRRWEPRRRWTFGSRNGAAFVAPGWIIREGPEGPRSVLSQLRLEGQHEVHLAEGPIDALVLWVAGEGHLVLAAGGSSCTKVWLPDCAKLVIHADGDIAGHRFAAKIRKRAEAAEWPPEIQIIYYPRGKDPAS